MSARCAAVRADKIFGFMSEPELRAILSIARRHEPRSVVEIGSYLGRSAVAWAEALPIIRIQKIVGLGPGTIFAPVFG